MRLFKKHKTKETTILNIGIKECRTCDINLRCEECAYQNENEIIKSEIERLKAMNQSKLDTIHDLQIKIAKLEVFKSYFDELYGKGLDIANWNLNGELEPFDNFYEDALQEMADAKNDY